MKVAIYKNLHTGLFSVQSRERNDYGRVVAHVENIALENANFIVRQRGRAKVLAENKKNVHAFVVGTVRSDITSFGGAKVAYNPYKYNSFVDSKGEPVYNAELCYADINDGVFIN